MTTYNALSLYLEGYFQGYFEVLLGVPNGIKSTEWYSKGYRSITVHIFLTCTVALQTVATYLTSAAFLTQ